MSDLGPEVPLTADDVRRMRGELGLSQRELAKQLGVTAGYIALLETGRRVASTRVARRLIHIVDSQLVRAGGGVGNDADAPESWTADDDAVTSGDSPFVVVVGPQSTRRRSFVERWLGELVESTGSLLIRLDLRSISDDDPLNVFQVLREQLATAAPRLGPVLRREMRPSTSEFLDTLEKPPAPPLIIAFENWNPRGIASHQVVADLGMLARRVRIIAITEFPPPIVPGVAVMAVPDGVDVDAPVVDTVDSAASSLEEIDKVVADQRGRLPKSLVRLVEGLEQSWLREHPMIWIALARALTGRGGTQDLERARTEVDNFLQVDLGEALRWNALLAATDLAIIEHEYRRAQDYISELIDLGQRSAGALDLGPVLAMKARALWEQSRFEEALATLELAQPRPSEDICRVANWKARTLLALGAVAPALRAAELGVRVAEDNAIDGGLAFSLTLAGQIEVVRGNLARARRLMSRAEAASSNASEMRVRPQILMQLAEMEALDGSWAEADIKIQQAAAATVVAGRHRRIWDSAYLTLARSRITRQRMNHDLICSMAHTLTFEAGVVSARAPRHPVVASLHVEAATAWVTAGYLHQAEISAEKVDETYADWQTRVELAQVRLFVADIQPEQYLLQAREIVQMALDAGAPYLATVTAYRLGARVQSQWRAVAESLGTWALYVAQARGWKRLARNARMLVPAALSPEDEHGRLVINSDGSRTLIAPYRGQQRARADLRSPLPDPFEEGPA